MDSEEDKINYRKNLPYDAMGDYSFMNEDKDNHVVKDMDDWFQYQNNFLQTTDKEINSALENVLILAEERLSQMEAPNYMDGDIVVSQDSIQIVKEYFLKSKLRKLL